uniref:Uncharacterized protein n=1 Tax=Onchocerca volvulus TaxID=6282 RepID=A0A2K6VJI2_ONCVO
MSQKEERKREKEERKVDDVIHELHVLYMKYFSLDDQWQPIPNRTAKRTKLLRRMAVCVDEILSAEERPNWLHPVMFHGRLRSAICSLPPIPDNNAILMPPTTNPRKVDWSKFSICNHSRPLENEPFTVSLQYHSPHPLQISQSSRKSSPSTSAISSEFPSAAQINNGFLPKKKNLLRVGALPNDKFRNVQQIQIERIVGEILRKHGLQINCTDDEFAPKTYLYQLPSTTHPIYE